MIDCSENNSYLTIATNNNLYEILNEYYNVALKRCEPKAATNVAINRLTAELEEVMTNWQERKL